MYSDDCGAIISVETTSSSGCNTMDSTGPVSVSNHKSSERKFFQWAVKWFYTDITQDIVIRPDAPEVACLLQSIGFQLKEFDKHEDTNGDSKTKNESLKVTIECGSSKMRAVMELDEVPCQCPSQDVSFWSVSGTGPLGSSMENMNKVVETGSNLLPTISKGDANVIRDVTQHLLKLIRNIPDVNQNTDSSLNLTESEVLKTSPNNQDVPFVRRHTQPSFSTERCRSLDTLTKTDDSNKPSTSLLPSLGLPGSRSRSSNESLCDPQKPSWNRLSLMKEIENADLSMSTPGASTSLPAPLRRQKTFDMDIDTSSVEGEPRPSPPKLSSSPVPVPQLCTSLGQISLQSEGKDASLVEILFKAKLNLERALKMLANSPRASNQFPEDMFLKPALPKSSSFRISPGTDSRPGSSCSLPVHSVSRTSSSQKSSVRRNVAGSFRKADGSTNSPADRKLAPPNRTLLQRRSLGARLPVPKPLGLKIDAPRPGTSANSLTSSSRLIIAAKRRVSPDPKNSPGQKSSTSLNTSSSQKALITSHNKSQPGSGTLKTGTAVSANKFGFVKKKP